MKGELVVLLFFLVLPFIGADVITPGFHGISINNYITNIADFPDYSFVSSGDISPSMCPIQIIGADGKIGQYYKFCNVFVYAIPKNKLNMSKINEINGDGMTTVEMEAYFESVSGKKVLENIGTSTQVPDISTVQEEVKNYSIDINLLKATPDNNLIIRDKLIYLYIFLPIVAIAVFVAILAFRKKRKKLGKDSSKK